MLQWEAWMLSNELVVPTLAVNDLDRARSFYEEKLGFEVEAQVAEQSVIAAVAEPDWRFSSGR
jgi:catechol 2,3-dioxygenase-like lactoylglutathione lyase family enzyme